MVILLLWGSLIHSVRVSQASSSREMRPSWMAIMAMTPVKDLVPLARGWGRVALPELAYCSKRIWPSRMTRKARPEKRSE